MKLFSLITVFFLSGFFSNAQTFEIRKDINGKKMYTGFINDGLLQLDTSFKWFAEAQRIYKPQASVVKTIEDNKNNIRFIVFMGTWCDDSHFVIPRFFKILDEAGFDKHHVVLYALDNSKTDKNNLSTALNVTNVPTIIVYKLGKELGRIIEYGSTGKPDEEIAALIRAAP